MCKYNPKVMALFLAMLTSGCMAEEVRYHHVQIWDTKYKIPTNYDAAGGGRALGFNVTLDTLTPYRKGRGWNNHLLILINESYLKKGSASWHNLYGEDRRNRFKQLQFIETTRINNNTTLHVNGEGERLYVPDQDMDEMPIGFIVCKKATEVFIDPSCRYYFTIKNKRWELTFGIKHLSEYAHIRERSEKFVSSFEVK